MTLRVPTGRRAVLGGLGGAALLQTSPLPAWPGPAVPFPAVQRQRELYAAALTMARAHVRGGPDEPFFKQRFVDAAFSDHIFLWDTCFIAAYAKYHPEELPIHAALDNFYALQDTDGHICREYDRLGRPFWPKEHPVSVNPPLLAFAELELFGRTPDHGRLRRVYPALLRQFDYLVATYRCPDGLFFSDAFGSGMDNIPRYPPGWQDDGGGIALRENYPDVFRYEGLSPKWNRQGRSVDFTAQMVLFARQLGIIGAHIGERGELERLDRFAGDTGAALNRLCWNEADGFYYDLGYGRQIRRMHIGMFWTLWAGIVPTGRQRRMIAHLTDPAKFWRAFPIASMPADSPDFSPQGRYWQGSVWAPANYMILKGLEVCGRPALARRLALHYYACVAQVFERTGTFWENYAPDAIAPGSQARADFCGWTALAPIALWHEYVKTHP